MITLSFSSSRFPFSVRRIDFAAFFTSVLSPGSLGFKRVHSVLSMGMLVCEGQEIPFLYIFSCLVRFCESIDIELA